MPSKVNKTLFQTQMGMVGDELAYERLRKVVKDVAVQYLDVELPVGSQKPESWLAFKSELERRFPLFRDDKRGAERLESAKFFAKKDIRRMRPRAAKEGPRLATTQESAKGANLKSNASNASPNSPDLPTPSGVAIQEAEPEFLQRFNTRHAPDILAFLEGCNPPLAYLFPFFLEAGIDERGWLWTMQDWPKSYLYAFLARNFDIKEDGSVDEKKIALQALLIRFNDYTSGMDE
ncbi:hypothetical protein K438DRAFT_1060398 [Mycena galopus ATCC 62051]|nr:hypothetical protein K438DRAFT_1060398 [Mycena galopus ATCC 62051]